MIKFLLQIWDLTDSIVMLTISLLIGQIKEMLGIIGLSITIFYTLWKWRVEYFERLKRKHGQNNP